MKGRLSPFKQLALVVKKDHLRVAKVFRATVPFTAPMLDKGSKDLEWVIWAIISVFASILFFFYLLGGLNDPYSPYLPPYDVYGFV